MNVSFFFLKAIELLSFFLTNFVGDKIDLTAQCLMVKIKELTCNCF